MTIKKKRTKIILPSILTVSLTCGLLLAGCQKTPDQSAVVSKAGGLSEDVIADPLKDGETQTLDLPEHWDTTVTWSNDRGVFHADQKLESVTTGNLPVIEVSQKKLELEQLKGLISYFEGGETSYQTQELTREYYQNLLDKIKNREGFYADNSVEYDLTGLEKLVEEVLPLAPEQTTLQEIGQIEYTSKKTDPAYEAKRKSLEAYGYDISQPAKDAREAFQWLYFGYLAAIKTQNGAAMSVGRISTFLDIYIERDLKNGVITETEAQELIDQFIIKLRLTRHLRTPEYDELFGGDPTWITESIGGVGINGKPLVTKNSFRYLHTLYNIGTAPEPNLTVLWSEKLPDNFKHFCSKVSIDTDSIQYENDDVMRPVYGDDYAIACCVSAMKVGKQTQLFGARCNLAKSLLYAINGGIDEKKGIQVVPGIEPITDDVLDFDKVWENYKKVMTYVAELYVDTVNIIHFMHDKYAYEASQFALHDTNLERIAAYGIAGLSIAADSLSAIKYATVKPIRNENGVAIDFETIGDFPKYGNDDDRADDLAVNTVTFFSDELKKHPIYRNAIHTLSALTITSNVMYGKKTGSTPDGRKLGEPLAPGANPMHGRDENGALASLNSVAKIPYRDVCQDGVSNTFSIVPDALGKDQEQRVKNLTTILDGYFVQGAHHLNVNVMHRETLIDAMEHPEKYPTLTIRVSGYAVNFNRLSREQQEEVIRRTFHQSM